MQVFFNIFCVVGFFMVIGEWVVFGGNQFVMYGGVVIKDNFSIFNDFMDIDGGVVICFLILCDDGSCKWQEGGDELIMIFKRWYFIVEFFGDGFLIVFGGDGNGG